MNVRDNNNNYFYLYDDKSLCYYFIKISFLSYSYRVVSTFVSIGMGYAILNINNIGFNILKKIFAEYSEFFYLPNKILDFKFNCARFKLLLTNNTSKSNIKYLRSIYNL